MKYFLLFFILIGSMTPGIQLNAGINANSSQFSEKVVTKQQKRSEKIAKKKNRFARIAKRLGSPSGEAIGLFSMISGIFSVISLVLSGVFLFLFALFLHPYLSTISITLLVLGGILGLAGISLGIIHMIKNEGKRGYGLTGIITGVVGLILLIGSTMLWLGSSS